MNPLFILGLIGGLVYYLRSNQAAANEQAADKEAGVSTMYADVLALKKALNPSGVEWLQWIDEPNGKAIREILRNYTGTKFKAFADLYQQKFDDNLTTRLTKKQYDNDSDYQWILSIINKKETVQQRAKDTDYNGSVVPTGKTITMKKDTWAFKCVDITKPWAELKPDLVNMNKRTSYKKGLQTFDYKTTGEYFKDGIINPVLYAKLATADKKGVSWFPVTDISYNF